MLSAGGLLSFWKNFPVAWIFPKAGSLPPPITLLVLVPRGGDQTLLLRQPRPLSSDLRAECVANQASTCHDGGRVMRPPRDTTMNFARSIDSPRSVGTAFVTFALLLAPGAGIAAEGGSAGVVFQRPQRGAAAPAVSGGVQFRSASSPPAPTASNPPTIAPAAPAGNPLRATSGARVVKTSAAMRPAAPPAVAPAEYEVAAQPIATAPRPAVVRTAHRAPASAPIRPTFAQPGDDLSGTGVARRSRAIQAASIEPLMDQQPAGGVQQAGMFSGICDACCEPECGISEPGCGMMMDPGCGLAEPGCGMEPDCGIVEPGCGLGEPGCGMMEPDCGIADCGSCVGNPGPDYWCFPVCLPRFKDLRFWGGVHGFKGPRDSPDFGGAGDGNFGFQEGVNVGGRAPLVSLLFPQLSYQLGYQAVQSQLHGLSDDTADDRSQQFVTAGVFRRVSAGLQFGLVWDMLRDDFQQEEDFHQLRYEISLKSPQGREFGFWGASHTNDKAVDGITYQAVDQYCGFFRCHFRDGGAIRFWGGGTNDNEGIFGGDFVAPLNNRWSIQTGFNYLITDAQDGEDGAREESWNIGMNLVWHYGLMAKKGRVNPHAPLFPTADNGWLFIDERP